MQMSGVNVRDYVNVKNLALLVAIFLFGHLLYYFFTGAGGPLKLSTRLVPVAVIVGVLYTYLKGGLYPGLGERGNQIVTAIYVVLNLVVLVYWEFEFEDLFIHRAGAYNNVDLIIGLIMFLIIMELSRLFHPVLFWVNLVLIVYSLFGMHSPIDFFWHPGVSWERVIESTTLELAEGVYGRYSQMALTYVAAFLLVAAGARGFEAQSGVIKSIYSLAGKHKYNIPQVAVLSSATIGSTSGSGAANTAVTGSFTIPLMKEHGISPVYAGAVETAGSMGGLTMPPLMAVAGFLMAEYLGVPYWDVVIRGFSIAFIYFTAVMFSVYLLSVSEMKDDTTAPPPVPNSDKVKTVAFFATIIGLIVFMGGLGMGAMRAGLTGGIMLGVLLTIIYFYFRYYKHEDAFEKQTLISIGKKVIETYVDILWYLVVLMATLGIMIGLFTVSGFLLRMGQLLMEVGEVSVVLTLLLAWAFGWIAGMGLPPTATYIVVSVVVVPAVTGFEIAGIPIDPWVAHFFVFLIAIWGELSPPTSLTAAVASRLSGASFMKTMMTALKICLPIIIMSFSIFIRTDVILEPGLPQVIETLMIAVGVSGVTFFFFGRYTYKKSINIPLTLVNLALGGVAMFYPGFIIALLAAITLAVLLVIGAIQHKKVTIPREQLEEEGYEAT